jgi:hypothetical protein
MRHPPAEELATGHRFPVAFRRTGIRFLGHRSPAAELRLPHGRLTGPRAGPQRDCHVAHAQDTTGQDASFTPGTVVRTRPATTLRPAPAALPRPAPAAPLPHPIGGGHLHETSTEVHSIRPSPQQPHPCWDRGALSPPVFSLPVTPGWNGSPWASSPSFAPRGYPRRTSRRRQAIAHGPGYYTLDISRTPTVPPTCTHAPSCRTQP